MTWAAQDTFVRAEALQQKRCFQRLYGKICLCVCVFTSPFC